MNEAYLCLGGNLGDCAATFARCLLRLEERNIKIISKSSTYTSKAWGMKDAPDFYNQVVRVATTLGASDLLQVLLAIEKELGRERTWAEEYESRTIDVDILFFNNEVIDEKHLCIPHPRMQERRFVLEPLNEIASGYVHPVFHKSVARMLQECGDSGYVKKLPHVA